MAVQPGDFKTIRIERDADVLVATIAHPDNKMNAVDNFLHADLARLFRELRLETHARAILLRADGRVFTAGGNINWFPSLQAGPGLFEALGLESKQLIWDLLDIELPIVCAINGPCVGLGASIALMCDIIFAADDAVISDPHVRLGLVAGDGGAAIWPLAVGPARAKQYLLTGDPVPAVEAERIGMINFVVPAASLNEQSLAFARRLAAGATQALRYTKYSVNKLLKDALNLTYDASLAMETVTFHTQDHQEALVAFREKRPPKFQGR